MNTLCVIPARLGSSRFPNKPLMPILGMPMIGHVALRCKLEPVFSRVVVATCDQEIMDYCATIGVEAVMTSSHHERASDRVQEATQVIESRENIRFDYVTMVQGDEPMVTPQMLRTAMDGILASQSKVVNLRSIIDSVEEYRSENCVKVVVDKNDHALYFSRAPIPDVSKARQELPKAYKQVCIIPFERSFLDEYSQLQPTYLEEIESVDMNRILEHGVHVSCIEIFEKSYPVDVPADLIRVESALKASPLTELYHG